MILVILFLALLFVLVSAILYFDCMLKYEQRPMTPNELRRIIRYKNNFGDTKYRYTRIDDPPDFNDVW